MRGAGKVRVEVKVKVRVNVEGGGRCKISGESLFAGDFFLEIASKLASYNWHRDA